MAHCTCGDKDCQISIYVDESNLNIYDHEGNSFPMYVNPNELAELIRELKKLYNRFLDESE